MLLRIRIAAVWMAVMMTTLIGAGWCADQQTSGAPEICKPLSILCWTGLPESIAKTLRSAGFRVVAEPLGNWRWDYMRQFNVLVIGGTQAIPAAPRTSGGSQDPITPEMRANLKRYVEEGGVIVLSPNGYWETDVWVGRWNSIFGPLFGVEWIGEHPWDENHRARGGDTFLSAGFWTDNLVSDHPTTSGIRRIYYSVNNMSDAGSPVALWKESPGWQTLVRATEAAVSYPTSGQGYTHDQIGSYKSAPPLFSVRQIAKGYVVLDAILNSPLPEDVSQENGRVATNDLHAFAAAVLPWLSKGSEGSRTIGGYEPPLDVVMPKRPPRSPETPWAFFRNVRLPSTELPTTRVLIGAHSSLSDGASSPEEMLKAARAAGYGAVFFTETMSLMTRDDYEKLQEICEANAGDDFAAFPGFEWEDEGGVQYLALDVPRWPEKWIDPQSKRMTDKFDVWFQNGSYPCFPLWLRAENSYPHPWFYNHITGIPVYSYKSNKLVENNEDLYLYLCEDRNFFHPVCPRLVYSAEEITLGASAGYQTYIQGEPRSASEALAQAMRNPQHCFVSSGPLLSRFTSVGREPNDVTTYNRWKCGFTLISPDSLKSVQVRDRERVEYDLDGNGKRRFDFEFTGYHGKNHSFIVIAEDSKGGRLIGPSLTTFCESYGLWQTCADQQNYIGTPWLFFKGQYNWCRVPQDIHRWSSFKDLGRPVGAPADGGLVDKGHWITCDLAIGKTPHPALRASSRTTYIANRFHGGMVGTDLVRNDITADLYKLGSTGYSSRFERRADSTGEMKLYLFRPRGTRLGETLDSDADAGYLNPESMADVVMVDGTVTAQSDIELDGKESPDVGFIVCGSDGHYAKDWPQRDGDTLVFSAPDGKTTTWTAPEKGGRLEGMVRKGGFVHIAPLTSGSLGFYPIDGDMAFAFEHDGGCGFVLRLGMKAEGNQVKSGTRFSRRLVIARTDQGYSMRQAIRCLDNVRNEFGLGEALPAFKIQPTIGIVKGQSFLQELAAKSGGVRGLFYTPILTWPCVPIQVGGLSDNWDAAVYGDCGAKLRRITVRDGYGYAGLDPIKADCREIWIGHPVICDQPRARLLVLESGPDVCEVQVHNPTDKPMKVRVQSSPSLKGLGIVPEFSKIVSVPEHGLQTIRIQKTDYVAPGYEDTFYAIDCPMEQGWVVQDTDATWLRAVRACDKLGLLAAAAGQLRGDWMNYAPIGTDEPTGPMEMVVRMKLMGTAQADTPVARLVAVCGDGPAGRSDYDGRHLYNEHEIAARDVKQSEFSKPNEYQDIVLTFNRPNHGWMGYHVEWLGGEYVQVDKITVRQPTR